MDGKISAPLARLRRLLGADALAADEAATYVSMVSGRHGERRGCVGGRGAARAACLAALSLPPVEVLLERCVLQPLRDRCALPGPQLLATVARTTHPLSAAALLHRVTLFGERG